MRVFASSSAPWCACCLSSSAEKSVCVKKIKSKNIKTRQRNWTLHRGSDFIHGGDSYGGAPAYIPPEVLLAEPTVDRMVPIYDPIPYGQ